MIMVEINNFKNWVDQLPEEDFKELSSFIHKREKKSKIQVFSKLNSPILISKKSHIKKSKENYLDYSLDDLYLSQGKIFIK